MKHFQTNQAVKCDCGVFEIPIWTGGGTNGVGSSIITENDLI